MSSGTAPSPGAITAYSAPIAPSARLLVDLLARPARHAYGPDRQNRADLYLPPGGGPYRVVVTLHGGSWQARYGKWVMRAVIPDLLRRGRAVWNVEYRRVGRGGGWPATFDDVAAAVDHLARIGDRRLDLSAVVLAGHSAGGQLALWAAARRDSAVPVARVVAMAAPSDLVAAGDSAHRLLGGTPDEVPERYAAADPLQLLPLAVPVVLVHTTDDQTVPVIRSRRYRDAARAAGADVELVELPAGGHRAHIDPRTPAWRAAAARIVG